MQKHFRRSLWLYFVQYWKYSYHQMDGFQDASPNGSVLRNLLHSSTPPVHWRNVQKVSGNVFRLIHAGFSRNSTHSNISSSVPGGKNRVVKKIQKSTHLMSWHRDGKELSIPPSISASESRFLKSQARENPPWYLDLFRGIFFSIYQK